MQYNVWYKHESVGFGCCNANICKICKTQKQEEPEVLDAINKIMLVKSSMKCHLTLYWFIAKIQYLPRLLENM